MKFGSLLDRSPNKGLKLQLCYTHHELETDHQSLFVGLASFGQMSEDNKICYRKRATIVEVD